MDDLENLLNWSMFLGDSNNGNIRVSAKVFLVNGFRVFDGIVIVLCYWTFDSPYVNILQQPKVLRLIVRLPVLVMYLYSLVLSDWGVLVKHSVV